MFIIEAMVEYITNIFVYFKTGINYNADVVENLSLTDLFEYGYYQRQFLDISIFITVCIIVFAVFIIYEIAKYFIAKYCYKKYNNGEIESI